MNIAGKIFSGIKRLAQAVGLAGEVPGFKPHTLSTSTRTVSERDMDRPADAFTVKQKLGQSWFTRRQHWRSRDRRLATLTRDERAIAAQRGWLK